MKERGVRFSGLFQQYSAFEDRLRTVPGFGSGPIKEGEVKHWDGSAFQFLASHTPVAPTLGPLTAHASCHTGLV